MYLLLFILVALGCFLFATFLSIFGHKNSGAAWGGIKGISLIPFYFQRKGTLVSEIAGNLFCFL